MLPTYERVTKKAMFPISLQESHVHYLIKKFSEQKLKSEMDDRSNVRVSFHGYIHLDGKCELNMSASRDCGFMQSTGNVISLVIQDTDESIMQTAIRNEQESRVNTALHEEEQVRLINRAAEIKKQMFG